ERYYTYCDAQWFRLTAPSGLWSYAPARAVPAPVRGVPNAHHEAPLRGRRVSRLHGCVRSAVTDLGTRTPSFNDRRESMAHRRFIIPVLVTAVLVAGCATKKFVREELQKSENKTAQSINRLDGDVGQERSRVDGLTVQVTDVGKRADDANGLAGRASTRAEAA